MKELSELHFRVIDKGLFLPIARRLAREVGKVSYFTPTEKAFPTVHDLIGEGFENVERVDSELQDKESVDCWVFPDIGFSGLQSDLLANGAIVWGPRNADILEISRGKFLSALMTTDLPMPPYRKVIGMTELRELLRDQTDKFIKVSRFRGDWETLHWRDWKQDEMELDARAVRLGPWKEHIHFYVFDEIKTEIEDGCDAWCIDGQFPSLIIHGVEAKDKAYLGTFQRFADLPEEVRCVNDAFGPILAGYGCRSFFSTEVRITKDKQSYFIDPTIRAGSPPSQVMCEMIENLAEIIWRGAQGECVDPVPAAKFGVQAILSAKGQRQSFSVVEIPDELDQWVKCGFCSRIDGSLSFPPDHDATGNDIGWLIGIGDTPQEAIKHLKHNVSLLPCGVSCEFMEIAGLIDEIDKAEKSGMKFSEQTMPGPEVVLDNAG